MLVEHKKRLWDALPIGRGNHWFPTELTNRLRVGDAHGGREEVFIVYRFVIDDVIRFSCLAPFEGCDRGGCRIFQINPGGDRAAPIRQRKASAAQALQDRDERCWPIKVSIAERYPLDPACLGRLPDLPLQ